jgi:hypothetical protein
MWYLKNNNKFVSYLIILFSFFILFLVTFNQYNLLQVNLDTNYTLEAEKQEKLEEIEANKDIEQKLKNQENITKKYLVEFSENELVEYIFNYVENYNTDTSKIYITDVTLSEWVKNDLWFLESNVNISANVSNYSTMLRFLDFFASPNSKYNFFIDSFVFPNDWREWSFNVNVPLKIYYN